jgi:Fe2+ transport system protein FeoA
MTEPATLAQLEIGETGVVLGYADGPAARRRFVDMGLVPGTRVTRLRTAPLGDPSEYSVFGSRVAVRRRDAATVLVERRG